MKQVGIVALASILACTAAAASPLPASHSLTTSKTVEQFGTCFVDSQDRASAAWSYVPNGHGGTFSNLGAKGAAKPYFLAIADRGSVRQVRLESASGSSIDPGVTAAVGHCV